MMLMLVGVAVIAMVVLVLVRVPIVAVMMRVLIGMTIVTVVVRMLVGMAVIAMMMGMIVRMIWPGKGRGRTQRQCCAACQKSLFPVWVCHSNGLPFLLYR